MLPEPQPPRNPSAGQPHTIGAHRLGDVLDSLYDRLTREGRHLYDGQWWLHPRYRFNDCSFVPAHITPDELTAACYEARKAFNRIPSLLWRFSDLRTNMRTLRRMSTFWRFNPVFRREVFKKHGMLFGHFGHC